MWKTNSEYRVVTYIIVNPGRLFDFTMLLHDDISLLWESIMGPRTGVDAVGGGHERFFEVPNFFSTVRFGSPVLERPFWTARFGPPVLDRPFWIGRPFWTACFGQPIYWYNSAPAARYLEVPRGTSWHPGTS